MNSPTKTRRRFTAQQKGEAAHAKIAAMLDGQWLAAATGLGGMEGLNGWGI